MKEIIIHTNKKVCLVPVTGLIEKALESFPACDGLLNVFVPHTTAAITINENADPDVAADLEKVFSVLAPSLNFSHLEGNSKAHALSSIIGCSIMIPVIAGKLCLGTWQGVFLVEGDGPRQRKIQLTLISGR